MTGEQIRWLLIAIVAVVSLAFCVFFVCKGKKQHGALVMLVCSVLCAGLVLTDFQSVSEYGASVLPAIEQGDPTVTLVIDATAADGGMILEPTELKLYEGESVMDILRRVCRAQNILLETAGDYVEGIEGLYEFDRGEESGWIYTVGGERVMVSCAEYVPRDGDVIAWVYVTSYADVW